MDTGQIINGLDLNLISIGCGIFNILIFYKPNNMDASFLQRFRGRFKTMHANGVLESSNPVIKEIKTTQIYSDSHNYLGSKNGNCYDNLQRSKPRTRSSENSFNSRPINNLEKRYSTDTSPYKKKNYPLSAQMVRSNLNSFRDPAGPAYFLKTSSVSSDFSGEYRSQFDNSNAVKFGSISPVKNRRSAHESITKFPYMNY